MNHLGKWNVRGINETLKKEEVVDIFREGKFRVAYLDRMKLKGNGEVSWYGGNGIIAREGVAILLKDVWHSAVLDFGCVSSRIL